MGLKRKRSKSKQTASMEPRKSARNARKRQKENYVDLRILPPTVMRGIVEKMSVEEHMAFRAVCKYAHDEVEAYWRSRKSISIPELCTWFPHLHTSSWLLQSTSCILNELSVVFNLFKPENIRKLSLCGVKSVNLKSLVRCVEAATGNYSREFFENLGEFDMRGCTIPPDQLKLIDEIFPNLHTIILEPHAIVMPSRRIQRLQKLKTEVTHHVSVSSYASKSEIKDVSPSDALIMGFVREYLPDVRHVYIDLDY